ncbi:sulfite exporter TauE/SafE family protein [Candidatus Fermentibacteria bacterium]|nr:sulfite exporter TauE/SafE family protein [Candidatus Fermentibacteria bacterium]
MNGIGASLVLFSGAFVQGVTGSAFSLLSLPLLTLIAPAAEAVPVLSVFGLAVNLMVLLSAPRAARPLRFLPLYVTGLVFTLPGILLLEVLPDRPVRLVVGVLVLATALACLAGRGASKPGHERLALALIGIASGLMNGLTTFSGPPVIVFLAGTGAERDEFRANLSLYFLILNVFMVPMLVSRGLLTPALWGDIARLAPFVLAGSLGGSLVARRIDRVLFRRMVLVLLASLGLMAVAMALA